MRTVWLALAILAVFSLSAVTFMALWATAQDSAAKPLIGRNLVSEMRGTLTNDHLKKPNSCGHPTFKLKAGMSPREAADAIDEGMNRWLACMRRGLSAVN